MKQAILNLQHDRKWNIAKDQPNGAYDTGNEIIYNTEVLKSSLCYLNDAYVLVKFNITIGGNNAAHEAFKYRALFIKCITKFF